MTFPVYCPDCEDDEVHELMDGVYECQSCGHRFTANPDAHVRVMHELQQHRQLLRTLADDTEQKKQTALLRKIATLLERQARQGFTEEDKAKVLKRLEQQRGLATDEVRALVNCGKSTALALMKEIGTIEGYRYVHGSGNRPSRIVRRVER